MQRVLANELVNSRSWHRTHLTRRLESVVEYHHVGMAVMRKRADRLGSSSVFTFATTKWPAVSRATLANSGATILHGPHHGAQKSTRTGKAEWLIRALKARSLVTLIGSAGGGISLWHLPQRKVCFNASYFSRLRWAQRGQATSNPRLSASIALTQEFRRLNQIHV